MKIGKVILAIVATWMVVGSVLASDIYFNSSADCNVLREYNALTWTNQVTTSYATNASFWRAGSIDGSGWNDEGNGLTDTSKYIQATYTLAGPRTVSSYAVEAVTPPAKFLVEYSTDGTTWNTWDTINSPAGGRVSRTGLATVTATKIRYTAYGAAGYDYLRLNEMQVFLAPGQTVSETSSGYSYFKDEAPAGIQSSNSTVWSAPNGAAPSALYDLVTEQDVKAQNDPGKRAFEAYTFSRPEWMTFGHFGGNRGQGWGGKWEIYSASGASMPALQSLSATTPAAIQAAGWTLQYSYTSATYAQDQGTLFNSPGNYKYLAMVYDTQWPSMSEFELYAAVPEPATIALLGLGFVGMAIRRRMA